MADITSVTAAFGNGIKREEYGPTKKADVSITATVAENEDGAAVLAEISRLALAQVAALLDAPKPAVASTDNELRPMGIMKAEGPAAGEAPPRRGRGRPKKEEAISEPVAEVAAESTATDAEASQPATTEPEQPAATTNDDEWASDADTIEVTDAELLSSLSKRAAELGTREPCIKLIASFATRTEGPPFKVQEIPQAQRKDFLSKLAALTA